MSDQRIEFDGEIGLQDLGRLALANMEAEEKRNPPRPPAPAPEPTNPIAYFELLYSSNRHPEMRYLSQTVGPVVPGVVPACSVIGRSPEKVMAELIIKAARYISEAHPDMEWAECRRAAHRIEFRQLGTTRQVV